MSQCGGHTGGIRLLTYIGMQVDFDELSKAALAARDPAEGLPSGQAELYEIWLSRYIK